MKKAFVVLAVLVLLSLSGAALAQTVTVGQYRITHSVGQPLSLARSQMASATIDGRAFFCGGGTMSGWTDTVDVYDSTTGTWLSSRRGEVDRLSQGRSDSAAAVSGDRLFVAGGACGTAWPSNRVDIFNPSGMRIGQTTISGPAGNGRQWMASASMDGKVFFAGGETNWGADWMGGSTDLVDMFDASTLSLRTMNLSTPRSCLMGASIDHKVLFAGGQYIPLGGNYHTSKARVDIYDTQLDSWSTAELSVARHRGAAATAGNQILFAGGEYTLSDHMTSVATSAIDIFDSRTGLWSPASLSQARSMPAGAGYDSLAFFAGGRTTLQSFSDVVDIYDSTTNTWKTMQLSQERAALGATVVGNQIIFAGGYYNYGGEQNYVSDVVDILTVDPVPEPSSLLALASGLAGLCGFAVRRRK